MKNFTTLCVATITLLCVSLNLSGQTKADSIVNQQKKYQAKAPQTQPFGPEAFKKTNNTTVRWLGMAGFLMNSRGTTFMIDPVLDEFDMPLLIEFPIRSEDVPQLDAVFITHADNDHFSIPVMKALSKVTGVYHSTVYVDSLMKNL